MDADTRRLILGNNDSLPAVLLEQMPQQAEVRAPEDDWTSLTNAAERRKLQNRLNQRLYRRRRATKPPWQGFKYMTSSAAALKSLDSENKGRSIKANEPITDSPVGNQSSGNASHQADQAETVVKRATSIHNLSPAGIQEMLIQYETLARRDYMLGSPRVDQLLTLIQFNVFRALVSNTFALRFTMEWLEEDAISPWSSGSSEPDNPSCPKSLRPTTLQRTISHHPWIDLFPIPTMRDNLLLAGDSYDETALCNDLVEFCDVPNEKTGLIVWGDPWDPSGWEVSEAFLAKWGSVIKGCDELVESTNYWRVKRGEKVLFFEA